MPKKKATQEETISTPKALGPFDIIKLMFVNRPEFWKIPDNVLAKNYFIINERMSIQFPMQAAVFNHLKINPAEVVKCWCEFTQKKGMNTVPGFVFIQGKKKAADTNLVQKKRLPEKLLQDFAWGHNISLKDLKFALGLYSFQMIAEIEAWDKQRQDLEKLKSMSLAAMKREAVEEETSSLEDMRQDGMF